MYSRGENCFDTNVFKFGVELESKINSMLVRFFGKPYSRMYFATRKAIKHIIKINPDIVHLHVLNGRSINIYKLLNFLKVRGISTVVTLHAEYMYTGGCPHTFECDKWKIGCGSCPNRKYANETILIDTTHWNWNQMYNAFKGFTNLHIASVSDWIDRKASVSPILKEFNHETVYNGVDTTMFYYRSKINGILNNKGTSVKIVLHVTPNFESKIKGGHYVLELAKLFEERNDVIFVIIGSNRASIKNVIHISHTKSADDLAQFYSEAHLTLLTSKKETFSMVTAESLCCGTKVVGFKADGPESIAIKEYSTFVNFGDINELYNIISRELVIDYNKQEISEKALEKYNQKKMIDSYNNIYAKVLKKG
jgi:glycosyltransferase involved in cell wall biosynthesis